MNKSIWKFTVLFLELFYKEVWSYLKTKVEKKTHLNEGPVKPVGSKIIPFKEQPFSRPERNTAQNG
jgi:hypothetical protein